MSLFVSQTAFTGRDVTEEVRDQVYDILVAEAANQTALNPATLEYQLHIYKDATNAWESFSRGDDHTPVINVSIDEVSFNRLGSGQTTQQGTATIHIDCYGYGESEAAPAGGYIPGDQKAVMEAQRVARFVRRTLQAGWNSKLQMPGKVGDRFVLRIAYYQPIFGDAPVEHVIGARVFLDVGILEKAGQYEGRPAEEIHVDAGNFAATYTYP